MGETDPQSRYDGGWEEAVDSGHGLAELSLDPPHPYNRDDHYTPAPRWATRHELVSQPFNDQVAAHEDGDAATSGDIRPFNVPRRAVRRPSAVRTRSRGKGTRNTVLAEEEAWFRRSTDIQSLAPGQKVQRPTSDRGEPAPQVPLTKWAAKQLRDEFIAKALGLSPAELKDLRRRRSAAQQVVKGSRKEIADRMGITVALLERLNAAESYAMSLAQPPKGATHKLILHSTAPTDVRVRPGSTPGPLGMSRQRKRVTPQVAATRPIKRVGSGDAPIANACNACGLVVSFNGECGCS